MKKSVNLYPTKDWVWKEDENGIREFHKSVTIPENDEKNWSECTNEEKLVWEEAHKQEELIEVEQ